MKYEWRKQGKALYGARTAPALKTVPAQNYIKIDGRGDPNGADFSNRVGALYALAYAVKAAYKAASLQQEIDDFAVCPLEGVWAQISGDDWKRQAGIHPDDPSAGFYQRGAGTAGAGTGAAQKPNPLLGEITFGAMQDGLCVEILHIGSYDDEPASFAKMAQFAAAHGLRRTGDYHREIYLSNANRVEPCRRKQSYAARSSPFLRAAWKIADKTAWLRLCRFFRLWAGRAGRPALRGQLQRFEHMVCRQPDFRRHLCHRYPEAEINA